MAIISWPEDVTPLEEAECIVCFQLKPMSELTLCLSTPHPQQQPAFLCTVHIWKTQQLILGLADHLIFESQTASMKRLIVQYRLEQQAQLPQEAVPSAPTQPCSTKHHKIHTEAKSNALPVC